jgi:hypothetical protein
MMAGISVPTVQYVSSEDGAQPRLQESDSQLGAPFLAIRESKSGDDRWKIAVNKESSAVSK